jgi:hypothetical protein
MTHSIPRLRTMLREFGAAVFDNELIGEWTDEQYADALVQHLKAIDLNEHRREIAKVYVQRDISERAKRPVFGTDDSVEWTPSLFAEEDARQGIIRLGNGDRVKMYEATGFHWNSHLMEQQKAMHRASISAMRTVRFLESPVGSILMNDPRTKTYQVMRQMGFWK